VETLCRSRLLERRIERLSFSRFDYDALKR
jgi:hypothetical protein